MSYSISTLLTRNLHDVFGENDPARRRAAIDEIFTEDCVFYDPTGASTVAATRSIASPARSGLLTLTFNISRLPSPRNWAMAGGSNGYRAGLVSRQRTPGLISSSPGTAGLPPFISFSTSYAELPCDRRRVPASNEQQRATGRRGKQLSPAHELHLQQRNRTMNYLPFVGRVLIGLPFAMSGFGKLAAYGPTTAMIGAVGLPFPPLAFAVAVARRIGRRTASGSRLSRAPGCARARRLLAGDRRFRSTAILPTRTR